MAVADHLVEIWDGLTRLRQLQTTDGLQPGLNREAVSRGLGRHGLPTDSSVESLYGWRNGTRTAGLTLGQMWLFPNFYLLPLQDALANLETFRTNPRWHDQWLPLFADGGGDFYLVDFSSGGRPIRHFRLDETEQPIEHSSLEKMLETLAAAFREGIFFNDDEGYLDMDFDAFSALAARIDPGILWWTE
ncbi:hypothetical protein BJY21_002766 [Kineosphaera limosa]|uniref:Knr4/Smi1-like domain-containing protein n=1 Tax=Kineosphaera limosa NBRC 100340 TaxID=1184609 RepID=K6X046_9MICO|nr:SMI1/KNR4 family protein [Kineosphaera limosa]NYE01582.1 hypothetical protein [Kineosphaera limosa]GAB97727.1 hypothetical protein KILIM_079_00250 [Kineosphaera limosa NBRC 100340]